MQKICVFCGGSLGVREVYREGAERFGETLARAGIGLVYGGGSIGLMGVLADSVLRCGGLVYGVIPRRLATRELAHRGLTELYVVESMHERKARMASLADAFVALPGGLGTFEELFEVITWTQLGIYRKPVGLLSLAGYFDQLMALIDKAISEGFVPPEHRELIVMSESPETLLQRLAGHRLPPIPTVIGTEEA